MALATRPKAARRRPDLLFRARREELRDLEQLAKVLQSVATDQLSIDVAGERQPVPPTLHQALGRLVDGLARHQAVTVAPHGLELSTQSAADLLGISRPRLIQLIEQGELRFRREGTHRRLLLDDVLAYRQSRARRLERALRNLQGITDEQTAQEL